MTFWPENDKRLIIVVHDYSRYQILYKTMQEPCQSIIGFILAQASNMKYNSPILAIFMIGLSQTLALSPACQLRGKEKRLAG